ncbi:hypothetical protein [Bifidobacterium choloepi]|uniref:Uncharacterized protein n=1 Tax=Bifidobacterium choloepi TaxID=2614131 RepID=A0A6I5NLE1_9BIFI|nr:hypothetical protein [Bifidobacterium choloepi]NEG69612.1 hypothetical protein [Bifidobacterium choloepi]
MSQKKPGPIRPPLTHPPSRHSTKGQKQRYTRQLDPAILAAPTVGESLARFADSLDERGLAVFIGRFAGDELVPVAAIAVATGQGAGNIRQEMNLQRKRIVIILDHYGVCGKFDDMFPADASFRLRSEVVGTIPELDEQIRDVGTPVLNVLRHLNAKTIEFDGEWVGRPTIGQAKARFDLMLKTKVEAHAVVPLAELESVGAFGDDGALTATMSRWLADSRYTVYGSDLILGDRPGVLVPAVLYIEDRPLTIAELQELVPARQSETALYQTLAGDDGTMMVGPKTWALREWGMREYHNYGQLMREVLAEHGGTMGRREFSRVCREDCGVPPTALSANLAGGWFLCEGGAGGTVTLTDNPGDYMPADDPTHAHRLFRVDGPAWAFRADAGLRGGDSVDGGAVRNDNTTLPRTVAAALRMPFGSSRMFHAAYGHQLVEWEGTALFLKKTGVILDSAALAPSEPVFLVFGDDGWFETRRIGPFDGNPLHAALTLAGQPVTDNPVLALAYLRRSIGADATPAGSDPIIDLADLAGQFAARGDKDIAAQLASWMSQ